MTRSVAKAGAALRGVGVTVFLSLCLLVSPHSPAQSQQSGRESATGWERLSPSKQDRIRAYVQRRGITPMMSGRPAVGTIVPRSVPLRGLPRDMVTEVPKITSYRYVVLPRHIAIVEPTTRTVVQVINR